MKRLLMVLAAALFLTLSLAHDSLAAGVTVYEEGEKYVKIGGRIQIQYHMEDPDTGSASDETTDDIFFRRLRPYIEGSIHEDWRGKFQFDLGKSTGDNEIAVKDAYIEYLGVKDLKVRLGNHNFGFSREVLTSSKKQHLVERTFVGDHNYGVPDKTLGLHLLGKLAEGKVTYRLSAASSSIDPDDDKLDFDTPVNDSSDFNEGWIAGGRIEVHPLGELKLEQGNFDGQTKFSVGGGVFVWANDEDNNTYTALGLDTSGGSKPDIDEVVGFEASAALRFLGGSLDGQYNVFEVDTVDPALTSGLYVSGETTLENASIEGGYMIVPERLELAAGYEWQDADGYAENWTRTSFGLNFFLKKHDIKGQVTYRIGEDIDGLQDSDENELFIQAQYVF